MDFIGLIETLPGREIDDKLNLSWGFQESTSNTILIEKNQLSWKNRWEAFPMGTSFTNSVFHHWFWNALHRGLRLEGGSINSVILHSTAYRIQCVVRSIHIQYVVRSRMENKWENLILQRWRKSLPGKLVKMKNEKVFWETTEISRKWWRSAECSLWCTMLQKKFPRRSRTGIAALEKHDRHRPDRVEKIW